VPFLGIDHQDEERKIHFRGGYEGKQEIWKRKETETETETF
jgi:hypothetical protein